MTCADMDHLVFLPSGDAALTRRAKKNSRLSAVVVRFSRTRKRYERQGLLVEEDALERAEQECLEDEESRARRRDRDAARRAGAGLEFQARIAVEIGKLFPGCPRERAEEIARHAGARQRPNGTHRGGPGTRPGGARAGGTGAGLEFQARIAVEIGKLFPGCPRERAEEIARHAGARQRPNGTHRGGPGTRPGGARAGGTGVGPPPGHRIRPAADVRS